MPSGIRPEDNSIEVIFKDYEEVNLNKKGFSIIFKDSKSALEAFKSFTAALEKIDKERGKESLNFEE